LQTECKDFFLPALYLNFYVVLVLVFHCFLFFGLF